LGRSAALFARLRVGSRLRRMYMALCVLFATPNWVAFGVGAAVVALAEIGVLLSYAALLRNRRLTTHGPYAVCRNPVYFCACAHGFGLFILSGGGAVCGTPFPQKLWLATPFGVVNPVVLVSALLFLPLYVLHQHRRAVAEERKLSNAWEEYAQYRISGSASSALFLGSCEVAFSARTIFVAGMRYEPRAVPGGKVFSCCAGNSASMAP